MAKIDMTNCKECPFVDRQDICDECQRGIHAHDFICDGVEDE